MKILVTGGAGFIGSFIVDGLVKKGHEVVILDNLDPQVHPGSRVPDYLNNKANFIKGDVLDMECLKKAMEGIEVIFHEAAAVGVGQSMYKVKYYVDNNQTGTANILDLLVNSKNEVKKIIVAASMSSYGEGMYECEDCGQVRPPLRGEEQLKKGEWELKCPDCRKELKPIPIPETAAQDCNSIYAITKKNQEEMFLNIGKTYGIPAVALRYFNVFGPRQSLSNPYTGVAAIFMSMTKNNNTPFVYEDGLQTRDFISVHDIAMVNILAMEKSSANYESFNVGSGGQPLSIKEIAETIANVYGSDIKPNITGKFRKGDVRHCFGDISKIRGKIGFEPKVSFEQGMEELIEWSKTVEAVDKVDEATKELKEKGLV